MEKNTRPMGPEKAASTTMVGRVQLRLLNISDCWYTSNIVQLHRPHKKDQWSLQEKGQFILAPSTESCSSFHQPTFGLFAPWWERLMVGSLIISWIGQHSPIEMATNNKHDTTLLLFLHENPKV